MGIDARIPMMYQGGGIEPVQNALMRASQLAGQRQSQQMNALQMQDYQRRAQAAMQADQEQAAQKQQLMSYLSSLSGQQGPPQPFNPAEAIQRTGSIDMAKKLQDMMQPQDAQKLMTVSPGASVFDPATRQPVFTAQTKPEGLPSAAQEYEYAKRVDGYKGTFSQWKAAQKPAGTTVNVGTGSKPLPTAVVKQQDDLIDKITTARSTDADLSSLEKQIASGTLSFGPVQNLVNKGKNAAGISDKNSRAFATFNSTLEKLRNDSLRLNNGVQTEGDAQREWAALFQNINDTEFVLQRLGEIRKINQRAAQLHQYRLDVVRENFGAGPLPSPEVKPALDGGPAAPSKAPKSIFDEADAIINGGR